MTTTPTRRRSRLAAMESLGFFEEPAIYTPIAARRQRSLLDTAPTEVPSLGGGRMRWSVALLSVLIAVSSLATGWWLYRQPQVAAEAATADLDSKATSLVQALVATDLVLTRLEQGAGAIEAEDTLAGLDRAARDLFAAAAALPATMADERTQATTAAASALEVERALEAAMAFGGGLTAGLLEPRLETDPALSSISDAALAFTDWRTDLAEMAATLPPDAAPVTAAALGALLDGLDGYQTRYLDAMREQDAEAAATTVAALVAEIVGIHRDGDEELANLAEALRDQVSRIRGTLVALVG